MRKLKSAVTDTGYLPDSPDRFNDYNIIPSNQITMKDVPHPILGIDDQGNKIMMSPGGEYTFPGKHVMEIPVRQAGGFDDPWPEDMMVQKADPVRKKTLFDNIGKFMKNNPAETMDLGLGFLSNSLAAGAAAHDDQKQAIVNGMSDSLYSTNAGSKGDYTTNEGYLRPDQKTLTQFSANPYADDYGIPRAQDGGNSLFAGLLPGDVKSNMVPLELPTNPSIPQIKLPQQEYMSQQTSGAHPNDKAKFAYDYFKQKGLAPHVAAGIVGNLFQESRLDTGAVEKTNTANGRGIAQWDVRNRWPSMLTWARENGKDPYDLKTQLDYVLVEPGEGQRAIDKAMKTTSAADAAHVWGKSYERPSEKYAAWNTRTGVANRLHAQDQMKVGGEVEMTDEEITEFLKNGGQVEHI